MSLAYPGRADDEISVGLPPPSSSETGPESTIGDEDVAAVASEEDSIGSTNMGDESGMAGELGSGGLTSDPEPSASPAAPDLTSENLTTSTSAPQEDAPKVDRYIDVGNHLEEISFDPNNSSLLVHGVVDGETMHQYEFESTGDQQLDVAFVMRKGGADIRYRVLFPDGEQFVLGADDVANEPFVTSSGHYLVEVYVVNGASGEYELTISLN